jgi:TolA-binding protein
MKGSEPPDSVKEEPPRLLSLDGPQKLLLQQASAEYRAGLNERQAWEGLSKRLDAPISLRGYLPLGLALAGAAAVLVLLVVPWLRAGEMNVIMTREELGARAKQQQVISQTTKVDAPPAQLPGATQAREAEKQPLRLRESSKPGAEREQDAPPAVPDNVPETGSAAGPDCKKLAADGKRDEARACFIQRSLGSGLTAETALYELSRQDLQAGDYTNAIARLRDYQRRFPQGQLQGEVAMSLVQAYSKSGNVTQALTESERLLSTPYGRERAEQLHWLRGNLFRGQGDYLRAQNEYEQIGPGSKLGSEALYFIAVCLEARGQVAAARQAYQDYLAHPGATRSDAVKKKLEQLSR